MKTIIFSELPQNDKIKYFNFLLENDINFSRDEQGNYVALVKVLNPAFYGGQEQQQNTNTGNINSIKKNYNNQSNNFEPKINSISSERTKNVNQNFLKDFKKEPNIKRDIYKETKKFQNNNINNNAFDKKPITKKNYLEIFEGKYQKFLELVNPLVGIRGKRMNINVLKYSIQEIYSIRFINDTNTINNNNNKDEEIEPIPFPNFVFEFFTNKFTKKPLVDQHSLDILLSIEYYKKNDEMINIFSNFLDEKYEPDDLDFFLYVRSCLEKEMKVMFIEIARENMKKQYNNDEEKNLCALNVKSCLNVANSVYGNEQEELLNSFMKKIEEILSQQKNMGIKKNLIPCDQILEITLKDYHENKFTQNPENNNNNINEENNQIKNNNFILDEDKSQKLKYIIGNYIKEKELDVFFSKLLTSYSIYEKSNKNIEETLSSIKELVTKKVNLLIKILFERDENAWFNSLKLKNIDEITQNYFNKLVELIDEMLSYDNLQEIPEKIIEEFSQTLLSTPELNTQINKLVMKRFE